MKQIFLILIAAFIVTVANAQENVNAHFMNILQQNITNPAFFPKQKISIGVANIQNNTFVEGLKLSDNVRKQNGQNTLDIDAAIANMDDENSLQQYLSVESLNIGVNLGKIGISLSHAFKVKGFYQYPKTFAQLAFQGNAQFVGETVEIGSKIDALTYNELALGLAYQTDRFNIGGRIKYLSGVGAAVTNPDRSTATVFTDPDVYQLTLKADYELQSSAFVDYESLDSLDFNFTPDASDIVFGGGNSGLAVDLGAQVNLGKLQLSASVLDIGSIEWNDDARVYSSQGTFNYEGLDITEAISGEEVDFASALDTLRQIFEVKEKNSAFETKLAPQIYLSANYDLTEKLNLGLLYYTRLEDIENINLVGLSAQYEILEFLSAGLTGALRNGDTNIGANLMAQLGPIQLYLLSDNIFAQNGEVLNFRTGLNVVLGKNE